ncbi:translation initiation factor IF-3 [Luteimicrobium subarcticum]|uniref:translation initiation factor IF-3 n=1 Tax=Luteimicrobium subarcticum TaxID=620910 RepID=UPI003CCC1A82
MRSGTGAIPVPGVVATTAKEPDISEPRINDRIRVPEVRLIGPDGEQVGVVRTEVALRLAQDADLDLVEVAPDARPPVCKLMDFGKFKYEADMKAREARRNQANTVLKEIRFRLKIDPHDYGTKKGHVERFLSAGDKVKVMIMFRGREQSRPEMGMRLLQRLAEDVAELGFVESSPKQDGRNMTMVLGPVKKKADAKTEQRRRSTEIDAGRMTKSERKAAERGTDEAVDDLSVDEQGVDELVAEAPAPVVEPDAAPEPVAAAPAEPVDEPSAASEPAAEKPAPEKPAATKPVATKPAATRPAATKPSDKPAAKPATTRPAAAKPATAKPVAAKPAAAASSAPAADAAPTATPKAPTPRPVAPRPVAPKPGAPRPAAPKPGARAPRPGAADKG